MTAATLYDFMADRMLELGEQARTIEQLFNDAEDAGFLDAWDTDRHGITNAMKARGFIVKGGYVRFPTDNEGETFNPVATDYATFVERARQAITTAARPVDTPELIERCDLATAAMPGGRMRQVMVKAGFHYIKGAGYWFAPQFTMPGGAVLSKRIKSQRVASILDAFEQHGWPLAGQDMPGLTKHLVTSNYMVRYSLKPGSRIHAIGSGLYVPVDLAGEKPFAMSMNIAKAIKALQPGDLLDDADNLRLYRIGLLMQRLGMAEVTISRSKRAGRRVQTMRIRLTSKGQRVIDYKTSNNIDAF